MLKKSIAKSTTADRSQPTRERILSAAMQLFQRRGYFGVGTAEILGTAGAPKGSMYHHFPRGKEQIAIEAVNKIGADVLAIIEELEREQRSTAYMVRQLAGGMARWLKHSNWREGTMLASIAIGPVPDLPKLHTAIADIVQAWREAVARSLIREQWPKPKARAMAETLLASLEGAMLLARIERNERIVMNVADALAAMIESKGQSNLSS